MNVDEKGLMPRIALLVFLAALFGWLLSFPLFGPGLDWFTAQGAKTLDGVYLFLVFHALGLVAGSGSGAWRAWSPWTMAAIGLAVCLAASGLSLRWPQGWPAFAAVMGIASAPAVLAWCTVFTDTVPDHLRGRTLAMSMALANGLLYADTWVSIPGDRPLAGLLLAVVSLAASLGIATLLGVRAHLIGGAAGPPPTLAPGVRTNDGPPPDPGPDRTGRSGTSSRVSRLSFQPRLLRLPTGLALFILCIYFTTGLVSEMVYRPLQNLPAGGTYYGVLPYIGCAVLAGFPTDSHGRRWLAHWALAVIGISLTLSVSRSWFLVAFLAPALTQAGYALADLYLWTTLADLSRPGEAPRYFGLGLGLNVFTVGLGAYLSPLAAETIMEPRLLALLALFAAVLASTRLEETLHRQAVALAIEITPGLEISLPTPAATTVAASQAVASSFLAFPGPGPDDCGPTPDEWRGEKTEVSACPDAGSAPTAHAGDPAQVVAGSSKPVLEESTPVGAGIALSPAAESLPAAEQPDPPQTAGPWLDSHGGVQPHPGEELLRPFAGRLTPREQDVVLLLVQGLSYADIREQLYISEGTLKTHLRNIYRKFEVRRRRELLEALTGKVHGEMAYSEEEKIRKK